MKHKLLDAFPQGFHLYVCDRQILQIYMNLLLYIGSLLKKVSKKVNNVIQNCVK